MKILHATMEVTIYDQDLNKQPKPTRRQATTRQAGKPYVGTTNKGPGGLYECAVVHR